MQRLAGHGDHDDDDAEGEWLRMRAERRCWIAAVVCLHGAAAVVLAALVFFVWLAFVEPLYPADGWAAVDGGCELVAAHMTAVQGVLGNTDLLAQAHFAYADEAAAGGEGVVTGVLATRTIAILGTKQQEAAWLESLQRRAATPGYRFECWVDRLDPYRVLLDRHEGVDWFIVVVMCVLGAAALWQLYVLVCVCVRWRWWLRDKRRPFSEACMPCFWPRRAFLCGPVCAHRLDGVCCGACV
eukprot:TRINITY_DN4131_c0_g1_i3.p1 TRINITY_DN4131_c0_g1~~TRINITY_DN4131_c0_g1_i3.p1  ORF type:complete len:241 (+),score=77.78 TRINITY_DN4131_c0_g1_i3:226-948(+)